MSHTKTLERVKAQIDRLDEQTVAVLDRHLMELAGAQGPFRSLTSSEQALLAEARADFAGARTSTAEESEEFVISELARRRADRSVS
jgi:hypothetical protein